MQVDLFNSTSNSWTVYQKGLGQARSDLAAASLPSGMVFFAGGQVSGVVEYEFTAVLFFIIATL
jgi:hypothetical protein